MNAIAPDELQHAMTEILAQFTHVDATPIKKIYSYGFCEDDQTLLIILEMADGSDAFVSLCEGEPIRFHRVRPAPKPAANESL